ncbi:MAG: EF-P beta-lysylation protein EpmB [Planctomycetaceae bacterium]
MPDPVRQVTPLSAPLPGPPPAPPRRRALTAGDWRRALADAIREPEELLSRLSLPASFLEPARRAARLFPLLVPLSFVERMRPGNPQDPLLRQVLPLDLEENDVPGFSGDPVDDAAARRAPGLLHKYQGRALMVATGACAVHCRYCFRRHYPYGDEPRRLEDWRPALATIAGDPSLHEVILSGGDPLTLGDARLGALVSQISAIPHVSRLRIHTRLPIVLPQRVTGPLLDLFAQSRPTVLMVVHANHPQELPGDCGQALRALVRSGVSTLNQAVLLRGVNDSADVLAGLCEQLVDLGVMPYYLHQLDRVAGAAHFEVAEETGVALIAELRRRLPGYAVPRYVREVAGATSKVEIA